MILIMFYSGTFIYQALVRNVVYNLTSLDGNHRFSSTVRPSGMVWIGITNFVATVASLGLLLPWAKVRMAKYLAAHTYVLPDGSLDDFVSTAQAQQGAFGDAFTDLEGMDVGAGV